MGRWLMVVAVLLVSLPAWAQENTRAQQDRQDLRLRQTQRTLSRPEEREGERRLDAIQQRAQTDPRAAGDALHILDADKSLATVNRPIPGGPRNPGLAGPGEKY
jgi:hypothetical protein